jgi:murein DD-endopeptidase MepM/ murein hydrolase activator NlpD
MTSRTAGIIAAVAAAITLLCLAAPAVLLGGVVTAACTPATATPDAPGTAASTGPTDGWNADQVANAATIVAVGAQRNVPPRGWVIAVATAMQESGLRNLPGGDRDSVGLFQQRPSQGWGTSEELQDPAYAAGRFYDRLLTIPKWQTIDLTDAAQAVQRSAFPDAYAKWEDEATTLVQQQLAGTLAACAAVPAGGWVMPVDGPVVSGFRTPQRPGHDGIDIAAPKGTIIRAAAAGTVNLVACNASLNQRPYSCDQDGSPAVKGCGWYTEIRHPGPITTRYCHLLHRPSVTVGQQVNAGQPIGVVGTSGHSTGPHLHWETHQGHPATESNAIDPADLLRSVGIALDPAP